MRTRAKERANNAFHTIDDWAHAHKVLAALVAALVWGFLGLVGLSLSLGPRDLVMAREWRDQRWRQLKCTVEDVGIAYRGNCETNVELMTGIGADYRNFQECRGPSETKSSEAEKRKAWNGMPAGLCAIDGDRDFWSDTEHYDEPKENPAELEMDEEEELGTERRLLAPELATAAGRQLFRMRIKSQSVQGASSLLCHNGYLLWAAVRVPLLNATSPSNSAMSPPNLSSPTLGRCAFEYGASAPSVTADWGAATRMMARLQSARQTQNSVDCWVLHDDACVIAFHSGQALADAMHSKYKNTTRGAYCCGLISSLFLMIAVYWRSQDVLGRYLGRQDPYSTFSALPTHDPSDLDQPPSPPGARAASLKSYGPTSPGEIRTEVVSANARGRRVSALDIALAEMTEHLEHFDDTRVTPELELPPSRSHLSTAGAGKRGHLSTATW